MRTLTSIQSATLVTAEISFKLSTTDGGQTFSFSNEDIVSVTPLDWRIPFAGGLGKSANYTITLQTSIDWIVENLAQLPSGAAALNIQVNSDSFQPHNGRVRAISRDASRINQISLTVFDRFLNNDESFPPTLSDSYSELNPAVINENFGEPYYYGKQLRPYYLTPVDCNISTLLAPTTIDSSNGPVEVGSIYYQSTLKNGFDTTNKTVSLFSNYDWNFVDKTISGSANFEVGDFSSNDIRVWNYKGFATLNAYNVYAKNAGEPNSAGTIDVVSEGFTEGTVNYWVNLQTSDNTTGLLFDIDTTRNLSDIAGPSTIKWRGEYTNVTCTGSSFITFGTIQDFPDLGNLVIATSEFNVSSDAAWAGFWTSNGSYPIRSLLHNAGNSGLVDYKSSIMATVHMKPEAYENFSIYATQQNCTESIISDNPIHIQTHIFSENQIDFAQDQASASQAILTNCGYSFNCIFAERKPVSSIIDTVGKQTNTYMWAADSGVVNFRTYENSGTTTLDATLTTSDIQTIRIIDNPLGFSRFSSPKGSEYQVNYDYDFQKRAYQKTLYADKTNNSFCQSASNIGLTQRFSFDSKHIMETEVASNWINKEIKIGTLAEEFVTVRLPARFFGLELSDVVRIEHPAIIGSASNYQITQLNHDYMSGTVSFTAQELLEI